MSVAVFGKSQLRQAFGAFPTGVVAVAALAGEVPVGLAASSFTSVSLDPPIVSVSLAHTSTTFPALRKQQHWGVSVLADGQDWLGRQLSSRTPRRFSDVPWRSTEGGAVLIDGAAAHFVVRVGGFVTAGDHDIALLHVQDLWLDAGAAPLVFHGSRFRRLQA